MKTEKNYIDTIFIVKSEFIKSFEIVHALKWNKKDTLFQRFYEYFVQGRY